MKLLLLAFFVAVATAAPAPSDPSGEPVEVVVNGLAEGEALDIGHIVDVKLKEVVGGEVAAIANPLHPFTAQGIAEAVAAAEAEIAAEADAAVLPEVELTVPEVLPPAIVLPEPVAPEVILPEPIVLPEPVAPEVNLPEPIVLPEPLAPEVSLPEPIVLPEPVAPEVIPEPVVLPEPVAPEVIPEPVVLPEPAAPEVVVPEVIAPEPAEELPVPAPANGEVFNDGTVSVTVNGPEDAGVYATLQSWVNVVMNYVNSGVQYTQQLL